MNKTINLNLNLSWGKKKNRIFKIMGKVKINPIKIILRVLLLLTLMSVTPTSVKAIIQNY